MSWLSRVLASRLLGMLLRMTDQEWDHFVEMINELRDELKLERQ